MERLVVTLTLTINGKAHKVIAGCHKARDKDPGMAGTDYLVQARTIVPDAKRVLLGMEAAARTTRETAPVMSRHQ